MCSMATINDPDQHLRDKVCLGLLQAAEIGLQPRDDPAFERAVEACLARVSDRV
jgi:hypothetical protein